MSADKLRVKDYIDTKTGGKVKTAKLLYWTKEPETIDLKKLPTNYCIKANHGSGWNIICVNGYDMVSKQIVTHDFVVKKCNIWLKKRMNPSEWSYKNIDPIILVEEYLGKLNGTQNIIPFDYKFFVFSGKVRFVQVDTGRYQSHRRDMYDQDWKRMKLQFRYKPSLRGVSKPSNFKKMVHYAESLSSDVDFVRVDLFNIDNVIYFSEFTHYPEAGNHRFNTKEWDYIVGRYMKNDKY